MKINLQHYNNQQLITFQFTWDPLTTLLIKQLPQHQWFPELAAWGTPLSPFAAWQCLRLFPNPADYDDHTYRQLDKIVELQNTSAYVEKSIPNFLYDFQKSGVRTLMQQGNALLADCPGAGKTYVAIAAVRDQLPVLICCPSSVTHHWASAITDIESQANVQITKHRKGLALADWTILTPGLLTWYAKQLRLAKFTSCVIDEAHQYRNPETKQTQAMLSVATGIPSVIAVTGTPIVNRIGDLFPVLVALKKFSEKDQWYYLQRYCGGKKVRRKGIFTVEADNLTHEEELRSFITPFVVRRNRTEIGRELPPLTRRMLPVDLTNRDDYDGGHSEWLQAYQTAAPRESRMIKINRLCRLGAIGKVSAVGERVQALQAAGEKVVVLSSFLEPLDELQHNLTGFIRIDGEVSQVKRDARVRQFQTDDDISVALCTLKTGGLSITLTAAQHAFLLDIPWTPDQVQQAEARIFRETQELPTFFTYVIGNSTIDLAMLSVLKRKAKFPQRLFEGGEDHYVEALEAIEAAYLQIGGQHHGVEKGSAAMPITAGTSRGAADLSWAAS